VAGDSHKGAEVRRSLQPVVTLAQRLNCAVLGITHFSKGTAGRDPVERVTGSIAFAALARLVLVAAKVKTEAGDDTEPRRVLMRAKSNIGPDDGGFAYALERVEVQPEVEGQRLRWLEPLHGTARELLADAEADPENDDGTTAAGVEGFLCGLLADGPVPARAIKADADGAGYAWRTVQLASNRLGVERRKDGMKGGWVWALNDAAPSRRRIKGAQDAAPKVLAPSASSTAILAPSDDAEVI
jgi:putative DNA primase/helicase